MTIMQSPTYQVTLPVYEGPLDLLLHLIERQELDITQVSLALVADQYLEHMSLLGERDPGQIADFLVVAAKLLLIKSRALLPQPEDPAPLEEGETDSGEDLVQQLILYRQYKQVSMWLREIEEQGLRSYVRVAALPSMARNFDRAGVTLDDLLKSVQQVLDQRPPAPSVDDTVPPVAITVADQVELISRETLARRRVSFRQLLERAETRLEVIVTLLALLEMVKQLRVIMSQDAPFGDIWIEQHLESESQTMA